VTRNRQAERIAKQNERIDLLESTVVFLVAENVTYREMMLDIIRTLQDKGTDTISYSQYQQLGRIMLRISASMKPAMDTFAALNKQLSETFKHKYGPAPRRPKKDGE
jgi:uncharacterized protein YebE (UPF0316 family)